MSKNIFKVLEREDSDAEVAPEQTVLEPKISQKQQRAIATQQREIYHTDNFKEDTSSKNEQKKIKDNYESGAKRPHERHSGTGQRAFGGEPKKQGFGKGNVGREDGNAYVQKSKTLVRDNAQKEEQVLEEVVAKPEEKVVAKPQEREVIMTLDEYTRVSGVTLGIGEEQARPKTTKASTVDPELKPLVSRKEKDTARPEPRKKRDANAMFQSSFGNGANIEMLSNSKGKAKKI